MQINFDSILFFSFILCIISISFSLSFPRRSFVGFHRIHGSLFQAGPIKIPARTQKKIRLHFPHKWEINLLESNKECGIDAQKDWNQQNGFRPENLKITIWIGEQWHSFRKLVYTWIDDRSGTFFLFCSRKKHYLMRAGTRSRAMQTMVSIPMSSNNNNNKQQPRRIIHVSGFLFHTDTHTQT